MMKTKELIEDFVKVWLCVYPSYERKDAINALKKIVDSTIDDAKKMAKDYFIGIE